MNPERYKDVKNYIHNELNITKAEMHTYIWDIITQTVKEEVAKALNDKERLHRVVQDEIVKQLKYLSYNDRRSYIVCTMEKIYNKIDEEICKQVIDKLQISLKEEDDGKRFEGTNNQED